MTTDLDRADDAAVKLCRVYQQEGVAAFVLRTHEDGAGVVTICMALPPDVVCSLLRQAADEYEARADTVVMN